MFGLPLSTFKGKPTAAEVAYSFSELSDDEQAEFFVTVAHVAQETWQNSGWLQWSFIGDHLAECEGAEGGRALIEAIYESMKKRQERLAADPNDRHGRVPA